MNRRDFLRTTTAAGLAALVPSWLQPRTPPQALDLSAFCWDRPWDHSQYRMTTPFLQPGALDTASGDSRWDLFRYATDGRVCVRVPASEAEREDAKETKLPPAYQLGWTHDWPHRGRWVEWPRADYLPAADTDCPRCKGTGDLAGITHDCEACQGVGQINGGSDYGFFHPVDCKECEGRGFIPKRVCPDCKGNAIAVFPGIQPFFGQHLCAELDRKVRTLGGVEVFVPKDGLTENRPVKFRFAGGLGLIMLLEREKVERRLREAR